MARRARRLHRAGHDCCPAALLCLKQPQHKIYSSSASPRPALRSRPGEEPARESQLMGLPAEPAPLKTFFFFFPSNWSYSHNIKVCLWDPAIVWPPSCTARETFYCFPMFPDEPRGLAPVALTLCFSPAAGTPGSAGCQSPSPSQHIPRHIPRSIPKSLPRHIPRHNPWQQLSLLTPAVFSPGASPTPRKSPILGLPLKLSLKC